MSPGVCVGGSEVRILKPEAGALCLGGLELPKVVGVRGSMEVGVRGMEVGVLLLKINKLSLGLMEADLPLRCILRPINSVVLGLSLSIGGI